MENYDDLSDEEKRAIRTAAFDYMVCLQMEDQFTEEENE